MSRSIPLDASTQLLVIAPHPDDESLGCGGLIQQAVDAGAKLRVWFVTNGDNNPWPQRVLERRLRVDAADRAGWGKRRRTEAIAALSRLGVVRREIAFANLPDQSLTRSLLDNDEAFREPLRELLADFAPTMVVSPSLHDTHSDHSAIAAMVRLTLRELPAEPQLIEYLIHGYGARAEAAWSVVLPPPQVQAKREAISCHRTQVALSRRRFLGFAKPIEQFESADLDDSGDLHPVQSIRRSAEGWSIQIRPRRWFDRLSASQLQLIACDGGTIVGRREIAVGATGGFRFRRPVVTDLATDETVTRASWLNATTLSLPAEALPPASRIFIKRSGGIAFFDEAGWKELAVTESPLVEPGLEPLTVVASARD